MESIILFNMFRRPRNIIIFIISLIISYLLVPDFIFYGFMSILGIIFMLTFSLSITAFLRNLNLIEMFKKKSRIIIFIVVLILSYFITSEYISKVFLGKLLTNYIINYNIIYSIYKYTFTIIFTFSIALIITYMIAILIERITLAKKQRGSILAVLATALGIGAIQICTVNAPFCGIVGLQILNFLGAILPPFFAKSLEQYSPYIVIISIIMQLISLYLMGCFKIQEKS